jgi:membrane protease YdiL (CAAX protease family)
VPNPIPSPIPEKTSRGKILTRIRQWALSRLVIEAAVLVITVALMSRVLRLFVPPEPSPLHNRLAILNNLLVVALLLGAYRLTVWWMERRSAVELDVRKGSVQLPLGAMMGVALMAVVYGVLGLAGVATFGPGTGVDGLGVGLVAAFLAAVFEELLFRAVLFRIVEQACGTTVALIASAIVFGVLHGANPGATMFSDAAIALEAGLLLAMAYALTRNLWFVIGIHTGWNFAEGHLFGAPVSGSAISHSVIHATVRGPVMLTGGTFGPEASIVSIGVGGLAALIMGIMLVRRGGWLPRVFRLA